MKAIKITIILALGILLIYSAGESELELQQFVAQCKADIDIERTREIDYSS